MDHPDVSTSPVHLTSATALAAAAQSQGRKRIGRPPKNASKDIDTTAMPAKSMAGNIEAEHISGDSETTTAALAPGLNECRRSSRKKFTKFDVLDVLNKNRKTHKIQIEARIDSNAVPSKTTTTAPAAAVVPRRFSMFENVTARPAPPLPLHVLEVFAKPKPTQSLIVAQVSSSAGHTDDTNTPMPAVVDVSASISPVALPSKRCSPARKRGRPRKVQPALMKHMQAAVVADLVKIYGPPIKTVRSLSYSDSDTNSTSMSNSSSEYEGKPKRTHKLRVSVKRLNMPLRTESSDSLDSCKLTSPPVTVVDNSSSSSSACVTAKAVRVMVAAQDENAVDANFVPQLPKPKAEFVLENDDSDSQIIFMEIDTAKEESQPPNQPNSSSDLQPGSQRSFQQLFQQQKESESQTTQAILEPSAETNTWSISEDNESSDSKLSLTSPKSNMRRSNRSSQRNAAKVASNKMTLEETFAEIAAQSSKQIQLQTEIVEDAVEPEMQADSIDASDAAAMPLIDLIEGSSSSREQQMETLISNELDSPVTIAEKEVAALKADVERITRSAELQRQSLELTLALERDDTEAENLPHSSHSQDSMIADTRSSLDKQKIMRNSLQRRTISSRLQSTEDSNSSKASNISSEKKKTIRRRASQFKVVDNSDSSSSKGHHSKRSTPDTATASEVKKQDIKRRSTIASRAHISEDSDSSNSIINMKKMSTPDASTATVKQEGKKRRSTTVSRLKEPKKTDAKTDQSHSDKKTETIEKQSKSSIKRSDGGSTASIKPKEKEKDKLTEATKPIVERAELQKKPPASFTECDALFKAMDKATAQIRMEEKSKKRLKQEAKKQEQRNTSKLLSDACKSINENVENHPKVDARVELLKTEDSSPHSHCTSSDSSRVSTPNLSETLQAKTKRTTQQPQSADTSRRNTICEERSSGNNSSSSKRRNSVHPKSRLELYDEAVMPRSVTNSPKPSGQLASQKQTNSDVSGESNKKKKNAKTARDQSDKTLLRNDSIDSTSSASQPDFKALESKLKHSASMLTSSDSSRVSTPNSSETLQTKKKFTKKQPQSADTSRRSTICEEQTKSDVSGESNKKKKIANKARDQSEKALLRNDSIDSTSSASQPGFKALGSRLKRSASMFISSDSSRVSTPNLSETLQTKKKSTKKQPQSADISRRNTICEERSSSNNSSSSKRRNSVHPKSRLELYDEAVLPRSVTNSPKPSGPLASQKQTKSDVSDESNKKKKNAKKARDQSEKALLRNDSIDSTSSSSEPGFKALESKLKRSASMLNLPEIESSESASSASNKEQNLLQTAIIDTPAPSPPPKTSTETETPDPLKDIAKFIEIGVNLLKRDYKLDDENEESNAISKDTLNFTPDKENSVTELTENVSSFYDNPVLTPESKPALSPIPQPSSSGNDDSESKTASNGVRRSHRIKQKPPKASVGRGVVRDKSTTADDGEVAVATISMEDQMMELAQIEAINEQFLRKGKLNTFQMIRENLYRCPRQVSKENAAMECGCFLTEEEEAQGHLCCGAGCINRMLMLECGPLCTNERCTNKRFQKRQCWPCRVFRTEKKGCGITAEVQIPPGEFIMEYVGEVIDLEEYERRQHLYSNDKNRHYYFMSLYVDAIIDATAKGNISRYINHSCDPNAETQKWTVKGELRIGFFSRKTIMPGEEITFDYRYQRYGRDAQRCYCEASNCRGWIGRKPKSNEGEQVDDDSGSEDEDEEEIEQETTTESPDLSHRRKSVSGRKIKEAKTKSLIKLKPGRKRKEPTKPKDKEYKAGRWVRPSDDKTSTNMLRETVEEPDVLEELSLLSRSGLKKQLDTLRFSRCMVRAKLLKTRSTLLDVLIRGELPCRRLFLDYHGLHLLHGWMKENGSDTEMRQLLLKALESLPIPNRTMLNDSRVYQSVKDWSTPVEERNLPTGGTESAPVVLELPEELRLRILALLQKWDALPEIFRIPKRERIEQMKEHEREADGQYATTTALGDSNNAVTLENDRYRQDRFRRDTTNRYNKPKPAVMSGNNTICTITSLAKDGRNTPNSTNEAYKSDNRRRIDGSSSNYDRPKQMSKELRREMFERKVAQYEAEKRVSSEDWHEHEVRCEYFGADTNTDPKLLPFSQNLETKEWYNSEDALVPAPVRCGHGNESPDLADTADYKLPASVAPLPPAWHFGVTTVGDVFYYNLRDRKPQWEPPTPAQRLEALDVSQEVPVENSDLENDLELDIDEDLACSLSPNALAEYTENKIKARRELRRSRLVSVRVISPRREEDRIYNQIESRKYKENKEKIRKRKELYRRRRPDVIGVPAAAATLDSTTALPIQGYLYSSDEEENKSELNLSYASHTRMPLIDAIVDSDKNVDEVDALNKRRQLSLSALPLDTEPSTSKSALAALATLSKKQLPLPTTADTSTDMDISMDLAADIIGNTGRTAVKRKLPMPPMSEHKRHRLEREKRRKSSSSSSRDASERFRFDISAIVAEYLRPYRKECCTLGRITSDEDYKFLIKRLSHHITTKEARYCEATGNPLTCSESVKHKSYDFINLYMRKKGKIYKRPPDEPDF